MKKFYKTTFGKIIFSFLFSKINLFSMDSASFNLESLQTYGNSEEKRIEFWAKQAECLEWFKPWDSILKWNAPHAKWFDGGKLNACYNCLDRHMQTYIRHKTAIFWENEKGKQIALSYEELYQQVNKFSNALKSLGIQKGDCVAIYLPMIPEAVVAMLSCARIGAIHTVIFGGFSANALKDRILDVEAKLLITADGGYRKGKLIPFKEAADEALIDCPCVQKTVIINYADCPVSINEKKDHWYDQLLLQEPSYCACEAMDAEDTLFILYTSGTTGQPKGIMHSTGGYMVGVTATTKQVFDIKNNDRYFCTADIGWITGHSYVIYGPLSNGMTQLIYDGSFDYPQKNRIWELMEKYSITIFYTAPTAIRTFIKWGNNWLNGFDLSSLRILGSVGEPINKEAWMWYFTHVGQEKCPIVDTWWQTETGSVMIASTSEILPQKPGSAGFPLPGINVDIFNENGESSNSGNLVITSPWPSMLRGIYKDPLRYEETYWKKWKKGHYYTGDGAIRDDEGYYWLMGRVDDVINVSGHRLGTMEIESALASHKDVAEAAAIAITDSIKGQAVICFVVLKDGHQKNDQSEEILKQNVVVKIGAIARPDRIVLICELPKTRSGKVMRRLLRDIAEGRILGDTRSLSDPSIINEIKKEYEEEETKE